MKFHEDKVGNSTCTDCLYPAENGRLYSKIGVGLLFYPWNRQMREPDDWIEQINPHTFFMSKCKCRREDYATNETKMNAKSIRKIRNIVTNARKHPFYIGYEIKSYTELRGIYCIDISKHGRLINKFVFCPDTEGNIESIAIYGDNLHSHMNAIRQNMKIFDMEVESVDFESGYSEYVDVYLKTE